MIMTQIAHGDVDVMKAITEVVDTGTGRVFGTPIIQDGVIVLPVARISSGGGGGEGNGPGADSDKRGTGGGLGVVAKPLGVFVIKDGRVAWRPAVDVGRVILGGQIVAITALLVVRALVKARCSREREA
jgi:uncharacterized spore protein YtfJ